MEHVETRTYQGQETIIGRAELLPNTRWRAQCYRSGLVKTCVSLDEAIRWFRSW